MGRLIGIAIAALPFVLAWAGPLLSVTGHDAFAQRVAAIAFFRALAWGVLGLGGFLALLNVFLSFGRPLILHLRHVPENERRNVSGAPILGSLLLMFGALPLFPRVWPCVTVTVLLLLDTGGPLWFLMCTWKDESLWTNKRNPNHTSDGIRQPADGSPKPSM